MTDPPLWERLRRARIVQVVLVYLGASYGILQITETLTGALSLPEWVAPVAIILLLVGLVIILATAWVQALPATTAAEEAGERPTDWQVAPVDALAQIRKGRLPHLTWGRAILGGVVALSVLFGGAGLYVGIVGAPSFLGPEPAGASVAAEGIAVVPFKVTGPDLDVWREGMVDLLSTNLDGMGGYRTIDARTVLARWRETVGDETAPDLDTSLRAAGRTGARYAVIGSLVGSGQELRFVTEVYDLSDGRKIGNGQREGRVDDIMSLIDDISLETMRLLLAGGGTQLASTRNLADLTTASLDALRAYLEGERYYRRAEFPQAVEAYERALEQDSTFALALFRLADTYGWLEDVGSDRAAELGAASVAAIDRLTPRNAVIVGASNALYTGDMSYVTELESAVKKYPDDPEAWFMLAESYIHLGEATGATTEDARDAVLRAIELDPSFAPYYVHAIDLAVALDDREEAARMIEAYEALTDAEALHAEALAAYDLYLGDAATREAAFSALHDLNDTQMGILWGTYGFRTDHVPVSRRLAEYMRARTGQPGWWQGLARWSVIDGRFEQGEAMLRDSLPGGADPMTVYLFHRIARPQADDLLDVVRTCELGPACTLYAGALAAEEADWPRHQAAVAEATQAAETLRSEGDPINARFAQTTADALTGYGQLVRGEAAVARTTLESAQGKSNGQGDIFARLWLAEANEQVGRRQDALRWYGLLMTTFLRTHGHYHRAQLAEDLGDAELARAEWGKLLLNLEGADAGHPWVAEAREALAR